MTPPRRPGSWRRTSSIDAIRPDGPDGPLWLDCRGRDLFTDTTGAARVADAVAVRLRIDYAHGGLIDRVVGPELLHELVGRSAMSGLRRFVADRLADRLPVGSLLALVLDEVPVVTLVSRAALSDAEIVPPGGAPAPVMVGICSGWREGGRLADAIATTGRLPALHRPAAPDLSVDGDPLAWHEEPAVLPVGSTRRERRFDLTPTGPGQAEVEGLFRDSLRHASQGHVVVHEYALAASIDRGDQSLTEVHTEPHVLPAPECPVAAASASRIVGRRLPELRESVRQEFVGISTCTHLNDSLRAMGDLGTLLDHPWTPSGAHA